MSSSILNKFLNLLTNDKHSLPEGVKPKNIANISFQPNSFDSDKYTVNVWFKNVDLPNQTTFKYKYLSLDGCIKIKDELAKELIAIDDDLFTDDMVEEKINYSEEKKQINDIPSGSFFENSNIED